MVTGKQNSNSLGEKMAEICAVCNQKVGIFDFTAHNIVGVSNENIVVHQDCKQKYDENPGAFSVNLKDHKKEQDSASNTHASVSGGDIPQKPGIIDVLSADFTRLKRKSALQKLTEKDEIYALYEQVALEIENGQRDVGVWAKAFTDGGGDEAKTKSIYIELMVERLTLAKKSQ